MATGLPCPNPACTHVFAPAQVQGATVLTCPRCRTVFRFRTRSGPTAKGPPTALDVELVGKMPPAPPGLAPLTGAIVPAAVVQRSRRQTSEGRLSMIMGLL